MYQMKGSVYIDEESFFSCLAKVTIILFREKNMIFNSAIQNWLLVSTADCMLILILILSLPLSLIILSILLFKSNLVIRSFILSLLIIRKNRLLLNGLLLLIKLLSNLKENQMLLITCQLKMINFIKNYQLETINLRKLLIQETLYYLDRSTVWLECKEQ